MKTAYLALGANMGHRERYIYEAIKLLTNHEKITLMSLSSLYETKPWGYEEQDLFMNVVLSVNTTLEPLALLDVCQSIENELGRVREIKWGPRVIDVDILLIDELEMNHERLTVPHALMTERDFVMIPLAELNPDLKVLGQAVFELAKKFDVNNLVKL